MGFALYQINSNHRRVGPTPRGPLCEWPPHGAISFEEAWAVIVEAAPSGVLTSRDVLNQRVKPTKEFPGSAWVAAAV
jgi:hypothetical protein